MQQISLDKYHAQLSLTSDKPIIPNIKTYIPVTREKYLPCERSAQYEYMHELPCRRWCGEVKQLHPPVDIRANPRWTTAAVCTQEQTYINCNCNNSFKSQQQSGCTALHLLPCSLDGGGEYSTLNLAPDIELCLDLRFWATEHLVEHGMQLSHLLEAAHTTSLGVAPLQ